MGEIGHNGPASHQYDITDFFDALKTHNLPAVSYLKAARYQDAHPSNSDLLLEQVFHCAGDQRAAAIAGMVADGSLHPIR
jgi:hypothetical protein